MATAKEMRDLTIDDLKRRAADLKGQLFKSQLKLRTGSLDNPTERTNQRRDLARVHTVLTEKLNATKTSKKESQKRA